MKKIGLLALLLNTLYSMDTDIDGYIRGGYQNFEDNTIDKSDSAISAKLKIDISNKFNNISYGLVSSIYGVQNIGDINNIGVPFYSNDNKSYGVIGEGYIKAKISKTEIKIGRQEIETPFINSDDIAMIPNFYEGITIQSKDIKDIEINGGYIYKWAGVDTDVPQEFNRINSDNGVEFIGAIYSGVENLTLQGWFYNIEDRLTNIYLEANYSLNNITLSTQYANQDYDNGDNSKIYGVSLEYSYDKIGISSSIGYNTTDGIGANNLFGGGAFLTSAEHITLAEAGDNGDALKIGANWDLSKIGIDGLNLSTSYLTLNRDTLDDINELDITMEYAYSDNLSLNIIYSDIDDKADDDNSFQDLRVFIQYNF